MSDQKISKIMLELDLAEVQFVMNALSEMPFKIVASLLGNLENQVQLQVLAAKQMSRPNKDKQESINGKAAR